MAQAVSIGMIGAGTFLVFALILGTLIRLGPTDKSREDEEQMQYLSCWKKTESKERLP